MEDLKRAMESDHVCGECQFLLGEVCVNDESHHVADFRASDDPICEFFEEGLK